MKRPIFGLTIVFLCLACVSCSNIIASPGEKLFIQAQKMEKDLDLFKSAENYKKARDVLVKEGKAKKANECRLGWQKIEKITLSYCVSAESVKADLKKAFPKINDDKIKWLMSRIDSLNIAGKPAYFNGFMNTVIGLDPELLYSNKEFLAGYKQFAPNMLQLVSQETSKSWQPYTKPVTYLTQGTLNIPRNKLPLTGTFKLWIPLPVLTAAQANVEVLELSPQANIKLPVRIDNEIGVAYFEFPLDGRKDDVKANIKFKFTHYQQQFGSIDASLVGQYDTNSSLYKQYTGSSFNVKITPEIAQKAKEVVANETNPYLAAKKIYEYVVNQISYSLMPHLALDAMKSPESVYVHEHGYGDCGAQSAYFSALCRSIGIPARTTGGFQMWKMTDGEPGPHFWAEFYLPNYGWLPVDTTAAEMYIDFKPFLSKEQQEQFKWFFFANQDNARCVLQKDVDALLIPPVNEPVLLSMAIQFPVALCDTMDENPGIMIAKNNCWQWKMKAIAVPVFVSDLYLQRLNKFPKVTIRQIWSI